MKVGYIGTSGDYGEVAARQLLGHLDGVTYLSYYNVESVIEGLENHLIDYGIVEALHIEGLKFHIVGLITLDIDYSLFKHKDVSIGQLETIAGHLNVLEQTEHNRLHFYSDLLPQVLSETSIPAQLLANGSLDKHTAVVSRKQTGEQFDLDLVQEHMQDSEYNQITYHMIQIDDDEEDEDVAK